MSASDTIAEVITVLRGRPAFLAGSLVAEETYGKTNAHDDVDLFVPTEQSLISTVEFLQTQNYTLDNRHSRVWQRWLKHGLMGWHTNSIKLHSPSGAEINIIYKLVAKRPITSLAEVLESFDFGLLGVGYDTETGTRRDMRGYLFPDLDPAGPLPLMPNKRDAWRAGFISEYNGMREGGRYAKYWRYGYDMSAVKEDLLTGYGMAVMYHHDRGTDKSEGMATIYTKIGELIEDDGMEELEGLSKKLIVLDTLDQMLDALE